MPSPRRQQQQREGGRRREREGVAPPLSLPPPEKWPLGSSVCRAPLLCSWRNRICRTRTHAMTHRHWRKHEGFTRSKKHQLALISSHRSQRSPEERSSCMQSPSHKLASVKRLLVGTKKRKKDAIKVLQKWTIIAVCVFTLACILSSSFPNGNIHLGRAASMAGDLGMRACVVVNLPLCDTLHWGRGGRE